MATPTRLYVVGVPIRIKNKFFLDLFANEGIRDAFVFHSKRKGQSNCAFLTFNTYEQATEALKRGKLKTGKRTMKLFLAHKWHEQKVMRRQPRPSPPGPSEQQPEQRPTTQIAKEVLILLASSLPFYYRAKMEQVSKAWREGSLLSHQATTSMTTSDWRWRKEEDSNDPRVSLDCFNWGIKRFGKYLKSLTFHEGSTLPSTAVTLAAKACKGLEQLDLSHIRIREAALRELAMTQTDLKSLSIGPCDGQVDPELTVLLRNNPKLTELKIAENNSSGKSLTSGPQIERLSLDSCKYLNSEAVVTAVRHFNNLTSLTLTNCTTICDSDLKSAMIANENLRSSLKYLAIRSEGLENREESIQQGEWRILDEESVVLEHNFGQAIESVEHLEAIGCTWMQEHLLMNIAIHVKHLTYLDVSLCTNLQDQFALESLINLKDLECLKMNGMHPRVGGAFLGSLPNIGHLECRDNAGITDEDIYNLLNSAFGLRYLDLEGTSEITRVVVVRAYELLRTRGRSEKLTIRVGGTQARPVKRERSSLYLEIDYIRRSEPLIQYVDTQSPGAITP